MRQSGSRFVLRELTRSDHERLDGLVGEFNDTAAYLRYLGGMAAFRGSIERSLAAADYPESFDDWRPGLIFAELAQDLNDLGAQPPHQDVPFGLPADREGLLGVLYVLEGSALGARLLIRRAAALGFSADHGARHLTAQTSRPESWTRFVSLLDGLPAASIDRAAEAARMTFLAAIEAFSRMDHRERTC